MEGINLAEEIDSRESSLNGFSSPTECPQTSGESPISSVTKEVTEGSDHGEGCLKDVQKQAREEVLHKLNMPTIPIDNSADSSSEMPENSKPVLSESPGELKYSEDGVVLAPSETPYGSIPVQIVEKLMEGKADDATSANVVEANNMPSHVSTSTQTTLKVATKSNEDRIDHREDIDATPKMASQSDSKLESPYRGLVDTAAPFESVREAVTKFGGIVDWKAHRAQTLERHKLIQLELEKVQKEIPQYKEESEAAELAKAQAVQELESAKRLLEELKHDLERVQIEEAQAKQDSELAQLRAQELEQGIADEASVVAKTQLEVAKERHEKAVAELKSVKEELRSVQEQYVTLVDERDTAVRRAEEVVSVEKEIEKRVEELTLELITSKESLELAHAAHHEAEEHRLCAALVKEQDCLAWEKELKQAQEQLQQLNEQLLSKKDLKSKIDADLRKLLSLNSELAAYMESKLSEEAEAITEDHGSDEAKEIRRSIKEALYSKTKELEEVKGKIEKAKIEAKLLRVAAESLRSELDNERASLVTLQQREGMASIAVSSLEAELNRTKQEIELVRSKEVETREKMVQLPRMLQQAAQEADDAKVAAQSAQEELRKAKEEAEQTKAAATTAEVRLLAVLKEIEASRASERLALSAVQALQESEEARSVEDSPRGVTLPINEYYALSKKVHEAEELANERVTTAFAQVETAKESESRSIERLSEASKEMDRKKEALGIVLARAERAQEGKLGAEQELRKWRAEHEQRRRAHEAAKRAVNPLSSPPTSFVEQKGPYHKDNEVLEESKAHAAGSSPAEFVSDRKLRRKKSFFPRMATLLSRKAEA